MTDAVTCPNCRDQLDVPTEFRGRSVKCATCQTVFEVPRSPAGEALVPKASRAPRPRDPDGDDRRPSKRGNGVVWFLLFGTLVVCGGLGLGCGVLSYVLYNPTMTPHKSDDGKFQIEFPAEPQTFTQTWEKGAVVKGMEARREMGEMRFFVKYYDAPKRPKAKDDTEDAALEDLLKTEVAGLAAGGLSQRQITTHAGYPAIDGLLEQGSQLMKRVTVVRIVLAGPRVYVLGAQGQNLMPQIWYVQRFFLSFQPADKAKPAPKPED